MCPSKIIGPSPKEADFEKIYAKIIAIETTNRIHEHLNIVKIFYDIGDYQKALEDDQHNEKSTSSINSKNWTITVN